MSEEPGKLDGAIDEALRDLTSGAAAHELRRRVLARIRTDASSPSRHIAIVGSRAHPLRWAAGVALVVAAVAGLLLVSRFGLPRQQGAGEIATPSLQVSPAAPAPAAVHPPAQVAESQAKGHLATRPQPSLSSIRRDGLGPAPAATDEEAHPDEMIRIEPLPIANPIADRPIEITPLEILPIANREIQIPLIDSSRPKIGPGQADKR